MNSVTNPILDPDCAICGKAAEEMCECEAEELDICVHQAEKDMLTVTLAQIREWVKIRARDFILQYYSTIAGQHEKTYRAHVQDITRYAEHYYNEPPHPEELEHLEFDLKFNIDNAWKASVKLYPQVLQYFYHLVQISRPGDEEFSVTNPPFYPGDEERLWISTNIGPRVNNYQYEPRRQNIQYDDAWSRRRRRRQHWPESY